MSSQARLKAAIRAAAVLCGDFDSMLVSKTGNDSHRTSSCAIMLHH